MNESIDDLLSQGRDEEVKAMIHSMLQEPAQTPMPVEAAAGVLEAITAADAVHNATVVNMKSTRKWRFYAACAAMIITILGTGYFWYHTKKVPGKESAQGNPPANTTAAILPGGDHAVLTLADGRQIVLDSSSTGGLAVQGTTKILMLDKGKLAYEAYGKKNYDGPILYNTLSTPNGGQYQIVLPDGTRVWLNAASSIRFPTTFTGERNVTMSGEAYFEVAHDKHHPFKVSANNLLVEVLGTQFNIKAYVNETGIKTSLVTGSLVANNQLLKPGEAWMNGKVAETNTDEDIAWKNGLFNLSGADLRDFMRQMERWYDITVQYEGPVPNIEFQGKLNRGVPLADIIDYLKNLNIECSLKGKTLLVKTK